MNAKWTTVQLACLALAASGALRADPTQGDSRAAVIAELGEPTARLAIGEREILMYPRGKVTLENESVTLVNLKSKEQFELEERRRAEAEKTKRETERRLAEERAERRRLGGEALAKITADPKWLSYSGDDRIEILTRFAKQNPDADVSLEMTLATRKRDREAAERRRMDDLEERVAAAERRAADAEDKARRAETRASQAESGAASARAEAEQARRNTEVRVVETPVIIREQIITRDCDHRNTQNLPQPPRPAPAKPAEPIRQPTHCETKPALIRPVEIIVSPRAPNIITVPTRTTSTLDLPNKKSVLDVSK